MGSAGAASARLEATVDGFVWSAPLSPTPAVQTVGLPAVVVSNGSPLFLVSAGHILHEVDG